MNADALADPSGSNDLASYCRCDGWQMKRSRSGIRQIVMHGLVAFLAMILNFTAFKRSEQWIGNPPQRERGTPPTPTIGRSISLGM
jgi:hypothetical protein